jgi:sulfur-carrier protein
MPVVRVPSVLRRHTGDLAKVEVEGETVRAAIDDLVTRHPALREQLLDSGEIRGFVNVYVDDEDVRYLEGLDTPVDDGAEIAIMPAVAGG